MLNQTMSLAFQLARGAPPRVAETLTHHIGLPSASQRIEAGLALFRSSLQLSAAWLRLSPAGTRKQTKIWHPASRPAGRFLGGERPQLWLGVLPDSRTRKTEGG